MSDLTPVAYPDPIVAGSDWDWRFLFVDDETVDFLDWTVESWEITLTFKDRDGQTLATLANFGSPDGTITLQADGQLVLHLPGSATADLPPTRTYINSTDPSVAGWRHRGNYFFDLLVVNLTNSYTVTPVSGGIAVQEPVT